MDHNSSNSAERILLAAESLFAEQGFHATTLRQITGKAGVNLAAVNYHHYDKESLYIAVFRAGLRAVDEDRLGRLTAAEASAGEAPVALLTLLEILARPVFDPEEVRAFSRILGRSLAEPLPFMEPILERELQPTFARFSQALRRHAPAIPPDEFLWRFSFVIGALHHSLATLQRMRAFTRGICRDDDRATAFRRFVEFGVVTLGSFPK